MRTVTELATCPQCRAGGLAADSGAGGCLGALGMLLGLFLALFGGAMIFAGRDDPNAPDGVVPFGVVLLVVGLGAAILIRRGGARSR